MVVTFFPATAEMAVWQERAASPLMCTVQAPQRPAPQPNFVPVLSSVSRRTQRSGMSGLTSTVWDFPLRINVVAIGPPVGRPLSYINFVYGGTHVVVFARHKDFRLCSQFGAFRVSFIQSKINGTNSVWNFMLTVKRWSMPGTST